MARGLLEKAGRVQIPPVKDRTQPVDKGVAPSPSLSAPAAKPKTAPGTLMGFMANQSEAMKENELLREQVAQFAGASQTRLLDPATIVRSRWANRHELSFATPAFAELKAEIAQAGGNVQPIKVRPIPAAMQQGVGRSYPLGAEFEIVFGHRRCRACLELGLPVLALIEEATEQDLFIQMERENRNRADLSAWEQGVMYASALDQGLYASNRQLANSIGRDLTDVGRALSLARLPAEVIEAFPSPLELQFRWAKPLNDAFQHDPDGLIKRATALKGRMLSARETLTALIEGEGVGPSYPPEAIEIKREGAIVATITSSTQGNVTVKFNGTMDAQQKKKLQKLIEGFF